MVKMFRIEDDWQTLLTMFPDNWRDLARSTKAFVRTLRSFSDEESVMRALLLHIAGGYSLRETTTRLRLSHIADVSDVALLKRLQCSEQWFKELCLSLLREKGIKGVQVNNDIRMRLVDGTIIKEPGKTGSLWRIHFSLLLPDLQCDYFKLTGTKGIGVGESFKQFPIQKGDCIVGDRGYSTSQGIAYLTSQSAHALVRVNPTCLQFLKRNNATFNLLNEIQIIQKEHETKEWSVMLVTEDQLIAGRICVVRKSEEAIRQAIKKLRRGASKRQTQLRAETEEFAKYVIVFTTLPIDNYPLESVLGWYRFRWQIELVFKRLKSLAGLGHLPKHDEVSARAWLYGKLFTGLLVEKLIALGKNISPWGHVWQENKKQLAGI